MKERSSTLVGTRSGAIDPHRSDTGDVEEKREEVAFEPRAKCRHVEGVGACEHEAVASRGVVENQLLGNCTAMRVAEHGSRVDAKMVEQARQVRREVRSCIRRASPRLTSHRRFRVIYKCMCPAFLAEEQLTRVNSGGSVKAN
jgi:hypothetical protein